MEYHLGKQSVTLTTPFLPTRQADEMLELLLAALPWRQESVRLFGKTIPSPRLQCWIGNPEARYTYSGLTLEPLSWPEWLLDLRARASQACDEDFNSVLCNYYRNGQDSMGWHSDNEAELGPAPVIASFSLGAPRRFHFRHRRDPSQKKHLTLPHNSLLIMPAGLQTDWQHQLPKTRRAIGGRVNLTFRRVVPVAAHPGNG